MVRPMQAMLALAAAMKERLAASLATGLTT